MKIVITAGGTSEKIDDVRTITNSSTGRLGYAVGTAFLQQYADELEAVYYLHGTRARHPEHEMCIRDSHYRLYGPARSDRFTIRSQRLRYLWDLSGVYGKP